MIYVYELPARLSNGFCFNGGNPVTFKNVDFWNYPEHPPIGVKPEEYTLPTRDEIRAWVMKKRYVDPSRSYLVLCPRDPAYTFVIAATQEPEKLPPARPNCPSCKGTGWMSVGNGTMHGCTDCYPQLMST